MAIKKFVKKYGELSLNIGITVDECEAILLDKDITSEKYKQLLISFYSEPEHQTKWFGDKNHTYPPIIQ